MHCPECNAENRAQRRYCSSCGATLSFTCSACQFQNDPDDDYCGGCGVKLGAPITPELPLKPSPDVSGERRQVTILFADLSGYTQLSENLDAEELHNLVGLVFDAIDRIVEDHGGTVHRHIGDEVMALFGTPVAHSDDPVRAVRAALETHSAMVALSESQGRQIAVHVGIASGNVVIAGQGQVNPADVPDYAVTGIAANLAARLNSLAKDGETIISEDVFQTVDEFIECDALGETSVKGLAEPVLVWRAMSLRSAGTKRPEYNFIGRMAETAQFTGSITACKKAGLGQAILVRGEAGMGKTRMISEFEAVAQQNGFACHKGLIYDFGVGKGRDAIRTLISSILDAPMNEDVSSRRVAATKAIEANLCNLEQLVFLNDLLSLPQPNDLQGHYDGMDITTRAEGKHELLKTLIERVCAQKPRLLVIEDVQWADGETLSDLAQITKAVQNCAAVLVMTSRIDGDPLSQSWRAEASGSPLLTIDIGPLREAEAFALAGEMAVPDGAFFKTCIDRAGGNPLFLEQLLKNSQESRESDIPATIQSLVLARIDRLDGPDKQALQAAAAIGQRFSLETLRAIIDQPDYNCQKLLEHDLVRPEGVDYLFAHALIREGVYVSLLKENKRHFHRRAASWFADRDPILHAEHLDRAEDPKAPKIYLQAAQWLTSDYHYHQASRLLERGLAIASDRADQFGLHMCQASVWLDLGAIDESIGGYYQALEFADDEGTKCQAWLGLAAGLRMTDKFDDALEVLDKALQAAKSQDLILEQAKIHHLRGNLYFSMGRIDDCALAHKESLSFAQQSDSPEAVANSLSGLADASYMAGRMKAAFNYFRQCVDVARENKLIKIETVNRSMIGFSRMFLNQMQEALDDGLKTIEEAKKIGYQRAEMLGEILTSYALYELADYQQSLLHNDRSLEIARQFGAPRFESQSLMVSGKLFTATGDLKNAEQTLRKALQISSEVGHEFGGPRIVGELARCLSNKDEKRKVLAQGEDMLMINSVGHNFLFYYPAAIEVSLSIGDWAGARRYATALEDFTRKEPLPWGEFFIDRGRALAHLGDGGAIDKEIKELRRLKLLAEQAGLLTALIAIDQAIVNFSD